MVVRTDRGFVVSRRGCWSPRVGRAGLALAAGLVAVAGSGGNVLAELTGTVKADGSSTVAPITMAAAEKFQAENPKVRVTVGISGTGGGFKKFLDERTDLRTDINDASRPIKGKEAETAKSLGIEFIELPVAMDGMAIVVHPSNSFCDHLSIAELKRIWEPDSTIKNWSQVRPGFPDLPLKLYGAGTDSGTFDYFTEAVVGKERASRSDYTASENDNTLVQGIAGDKGSLGYFGFSYYENNKQRLKLLAIDGGDGKLVKPDLTTIRTGAYKPLSRPLFLYVNKASIGRPEVKAFVEYVLNSGRSIVEHPRVGYVALSDELYTIAKKRFADGTPGTVFGDGAHGAATPLIDRYKGN